MAKHDLFARHIELLRSNLSTSGHTQIVPFLTEHTRLKGSRFSFDNHEYQIDILKDPHPRLVIMKVAQAGISEIMARLALARAVLVPGFTTIYTLPSATAAVDFMRSRIDPLVEGSEYLKGLVHRTMDNAGVKRFGDSWLYAKGCSVDTQAISVPADLVINDEVDNSNRTTMTLFESRLLHSEYKMLIRLSTPTVPGRGIDDAFKHSKQKVRVCKCCHCNHTFYPDYFEHVKIPGFDASLSEITKSHFRDPKFRWAEAAVICPHCGKVPDLSAKFREWVVVNPDDNFVDSGYRISPFDCPASRSAASLVQSSVAYEKEQDFYNQALGIPLEDRENSLMEDELLSCIDRGLTSTGGVNVFGLDIGKVCWATVAAVQGDGSLVIVHREGIPIRSVVDRSLELCRKFRVRLAVGDSLPETQVIYNIQKKLPFFFAATYMGSKGTELFRVKDKNSDPSEGVEFIRQVSIARDRGFDTVMHMVRGGLVTVMANDELDLTWVEHLRDMKRIKVLLDDGSLVFTWEKSDKGDDHLHHSLLYAVVASRLLGKATYWGAIPLIGKFVSKGI